MAGQVSLSQRSFGSDEYEDGEIKKLVRGSQLWTALMSELWINCSPETQQHFRQMMLQPTYFMGTVISTCRHQVELTIIPFEAGSTRPGSIQKIAVSLDDFGRFL